MLKIYKINVIACRCLKYCWFGFEFHNHHETIKNHETSVAKLHISRLTMAFSSLLASSLKTSISNAYEDVYHVTGTIFSHISATQNYINLCMFAAPVYSFKLCSSSCGPQFADRQRRKYVQCVPDNLFLGRW